MHKLQMGYKTMNRCDSEDIRNLLLHQKLILNSVFASMLSQNTNFYLTNNKPVYFGWSPTQFGCFVVETLLAFTEFLSGLIC